APIGSGPGGGCSRTRGVPIMQGLCVRLHALDNPAFLTRLVASRFAGDQFRFHWKGRFNLVCERCEGATIKPADLYQISLVFSGGNQMQTAKYNRNLVAVVILAVEFLVAGVDLGIKAIQVVVEDSRLAFEHFVILSGVGHGLSPSYAVAGCSRTSRTATPASRARRAMSAVPRPPGNAMTRLGFPLSIIA